MHVLEQSSDLYSKLERSGFIEIGNPYISKNNFVEVYRSFDDFINLIENEKEFKKCMKLSEEEFNSVEELNQRYCSAPPSYRNPKEDTQKRHKKVYFQFIKEHYFNIKENHPELLQKYPEAARFFEKMLHVDQTAKNIFADILDKLDAERPGIKSALYGKHKELTVVSKIVRYEKSESRWGTTAHFDKSGVTLIWDSDDADNDSLVLCSDSENPTIEKLDKPQRKFSKVVDLTSTIFIPGSCLSKVGINIKPTLHGVLPIKNEFRHAIISFALVPDIDTKDIVTDFL